MQETGVQPSTVYVDLGYRGVDADNPGIAIKHRGKFKTLSAQGENCSGGAKRWSRSLGT